MAFLHGKSGVFKLGTAATPGTVVDISAYITDVQMPRDAKMHDTTVLGKNAQTFLAGLINGTISLSGVLDIVLDTQMAALLAINNVSFEFGPQGPTVGNIKYTGTCLLVKYDVNDKVSDVLHWTAQLQITDVVTRTTY